MKKIKLIYKKELLEKWKRGKLYRDWAKKYPEIFDNVDITLAKNQPKYHFGEWLVAIHYAKKGYKSLLEKIGCQNHKRKNKIIAQYLDYEKLMKIPKLPDLFVYKNNEFFFVEVKKENDSLSDGQKRCFRRIEKNFNCDVYLCNLEAE